MSHLHIPDGVLPNWLVLAGWILAAIVLGLCIFRIRRGEIVRKVPLIGIISALMIVCMTLPVIPFAYHVNLSVVAGIILGPAVAFIAVFIVDLIIAMFGHGGITVVGLNTIIIGAEAVFGYYLFRAVLLMLGKGSPGRSAGIAAVLSLMASTSLLIGVLYLSQLSPGILIHSGPGNAQHADVEHPEQSPGIHTIDIKKFARTAALLLSLGWALEGLISGLVIKYVARVRPDLLPIDST